MTERRNSGVTDLEIKRGASSTSSDDDQRRDVTEEEPGGVSCENRGSDITPSGEVQKIKVDNQKPKSTILDKKEQPGEPSKIKRKPVKTLYIETDPEMGALAERMNTAICFSAPTIASVQVRKGFLFDLEVSGSEFWRRHDEIWNNRKRKLDDRREQRHGFFAADIIKYGAVDMLSPRPPNLTNDIHPLYHRDAFTGCEDDVYKQFVPALRLASMWMVSKCRSICSIKKQY